MSGSLETQIKLLKETIHNLEGKPLTIAVIGQHGCGKSSFINTVLAVLSGNYCEYATSGSYGNRGGHVTRRVTKYTKKDYLKKENRDEMRHSYPTFLDMMGFQNDGNVKEFLKNVFEGRVADGAQFNQVREQRNTLENLLQLTLNLGNENIPKVDRIIVVASAVSTEFPEELINAVKLQALEGTRDILLFGVLTHKDKINGNVENFREFEKNFQECLGLSPMRYLLCKNYCKDFPADNERNSDVEVPVMRFLRQVIDPKRNVFEKKNNIIEHLYTRMNMKLKTITVLFLQIFLMMFYLFWIMLAPTEIRSFCSSNGKFEQGQSLQVFEYVCKLNSDGKIMEKPSLYYLFLFLALVYYGVHPLFSLYLRYNAKLEAVLNQRILTLIGMKIRGN